MELEAVPFSQFVQLSLSYQIFSADLTDEVFLHENELIPFSPFSSFSPNTSLEKSEKTVN